MLGDLVGAERAEQAFEVGRPSRRSLDAIGVASYAELRELRQMLASSSCESTLCARLAPKLGRPTSTTVPLPKRIGDDRRRAIGDPGGRGVRLLGGGRLDRLVAG